MLPEFPCPGEIIEREESSTGQVRVAICSARGTDFQYVPDSDWLRVISRNANPRLTTLPPPGGAIPPSRSFQGT